MKTIYIPTDADSYGSTSDTNIATVKSRMEFLAAAIGYDHEYGERPRDDKDEEDSRGFPSMTERVFELAMEADDPNPSRDSADLINAVAAMKRELPFD